MSIRKAMIKDLSRIAEIYVFNNRMNYFPIFKDAGFSFGELQVVSLVDHYFKKKEIIENIYVFDDGLVKGFISFYQRHGFRLTGQKQFEEGTTEYLVKLERN